MNVRAYMYICMYDLIYVWTDLVVSDRQPRPKTLAASILHISRHGTVYTQPGRRSTN
jgi:hypothetical protein